MEIKELREKVRDTRSDVRGAELYLSDAKKQYYAALAEYSNAVAMKVYGLKIGDVIEWNKKTFRKNEPVRIQITKFNCSVREDYDDDFDPTITGTVIKKDGTLGVKEETWWSYQSIPFVKIEPTPAP